VSSERGKACAHEENADALLAHLEQLKLSWCARNPGREWSTPLVIAETSSRFSPEETNVAFSSLVAVLERVVRWEATPLVVAHVSQNAARSGDTSQHATRGATSLPNASRASLVLARVAEGEKDSRGDELPRNLLRFHGTAKASRGPKVPPVLLQPAVSVDRLVFRRWSPDAKPEDGRSPEEVTTANRRATGEKLRDFVAKKASDGVFLTTRQLAENKGYRSELGISRDAIREAIIRAVKDEFLGKKEANLRGGGEQLYAKGVGSSPPWPNGGAENGP
jgi:hypothetical protein